MRLGCKMAAFEQIDMSIDPDGIFTVSLARKRARPALAGTPAQFAAAQ